MNIAKSIKSYLYKTFFLLTFLASAQTPKFKVVLDAGHGGKDFGAAYYGLAEKNIALAVALKIGKILEKNPNIKVVYTRKTDVFIELDQRANIANREDANLFISIHCNANKSTIADGFETYVMGVARNKSNLEVAKLENDVVTLEKDYKQTYEGYNPNSPESTIGILMLQEEFRENSVTLAGKIQANFAENSNRKDRGVKEAGFLVLRKISMPRILIEMGFISNARESHFLSSDEGQDEIALDIANAIFSYKKEYFGVEKNEPKIDKPTSRIFLKKEDPKPIKNDTTVKLPITNKETVIYSSNEIIFKVQITATTKKIDLASKNFKGLDKISTESDGKLYKYFFGNTSDYDEAKKDLNQAKSKGYKTAYLVAFKNGQQISIKEALLK